MELNQIGNKIRELRIRHGLTQAELGKLVGVSMQAVSKWERGGTPDIEVLLSLAEYFGVSLDEMFGRTVQDPRQLDDLLYYAILQTPEKKRAEQACLYCWSIFKGMSGIPEMQDAEYSTAAPENPENSRGRIFTNEGIGYALATQDAHMVAIMPEPEEGYASLLGDPKPYTDLFRLLSDPDTFQLLLFLCTRAKSLFSLGLASQATGVPQDKAAQVFAEFVRRDWLVEERADVDKGSVTLYRANYKEYFAFFLHFAKEMTISPRFWFLSNCTKRTEPLLRGEAE